MATFVIETYLSRARPTELGAATTRLRRAIAALSTAVRPFRHVRSFYVAEDEMCFHVVEAPSIEAAAAVIRIAGISAERIVEAEAAGPSGPDASR